MDWDDETCLAKINETLANPTSYEPSDKASARYINIGTTSCGVVIQTIINSKTKQIISSFPDRKEMKKLQENK